MGLFVNMVVFKCPNNNNAKISKRLEKTTKNIPLKAVNKPQNAPVVVHGREELSLFDSPAEHELTSPRP